VLCLQSGIFLWLLRLSQMGGLVNLLSHPVITGFVNAAAILIIVSQLPAAIGIGAGDAANPFSQVLALAANLDKSIRCRRLWRWDAWPCCGWCRVTACAHGGCFWKDAPDEHPIRRSDQSWSP
jgi:hypothetical protein